MDVRFIPLFTLIMLHRHPMYTSVLLWLRACVVLSLVLLSSCSPDEVVYTNTDTGWTILATTSDNPSRLSLIHQPENSVKQTDAYAAANGRTLEGQVTKIVQFDTALYLLMPDIKKIEVVNRSSYKSIATISTAPHAVVDLCFANSTTAYSANADSTVSIIDVTVYRLLSDRDIIVPAVPTSIAAVGNQVCVCSQQSSMCSIIDTPTNTLSQSFFTPTAPTFVGSDKTTGSFVIVCLGDGKLSDLRPMSAAHLLVYSTQTRSVGTNIVITASGVATEQIKPQALAVLEGGYAYLALNDELILMDIKNRTSLGYITSGSFSAFAYNSRTNQLACFDNTADRTSVTLIEVSLTAVKSTTLLPQKLNAFVVL